MEAGEVKRNNLFISGLNEKDVDHFTSDIGLFLRRKCDTPYKLIAHEVCGVHVLKPSTTAELSDEEYFDSLSTDKIPLSSYGLKAEKHNIIIERYPKLNIRFSKNPKRRVRWIFSMGKWNSTIRYLK